MTDPFIALLVVFTILQVKHFICDYPLQTHYQLKNKGTYGHPGGILHSGIQALGTTAAFIAVPPTLGLGVAIVVGEFLVHYHVDWTKANVMRRAGYTSDQSQFWWAIGADQLIHHLTYVAIGGILVGVMIGTS
ncbi:DUF3307 domain-containing protein [Bauldia litoralis]|uniref:DUF3307 domain-containing protein n=1 Tax=Bauldia litoralis TaxID=665467 RepID=UPI003267F564